MIFPFTLCSFTKVKYYASLKISLTLSEILRLNHLKVRGERVASFAHCCLCLVVALRDSDE